ncbi:MAG: phosphatase PAP2 family protein [Candidatus Eremiobacteraeota bacterium]|nr:phosphatase PAP2 family protein [Candidatus Eremiobacteraeota bacterium]
MHYRLALLFFLLLGLGILGPVDLFAQRHLFLGPSQLAIWSSHCGDMIAYLTAALTAVFLYRLRRAELPVYGLLLAGQHFLTCFFKWFFHTVRPLHLHQVGGYAYPSGHTVTALCVFGYLSIQNHGWKRIVLAWIPLQVAWSRVALGHHWFSDVLGGLLLGGMWLHFCLALRADLTKS